MTKPRTVPFAGIRGRITLRRWENPDARYVALIAHGYGEHAGRYEHVADHLVAHGASVFAPDHLGHGLSEGEQALVEDLEDVVTDLHGVAGLARSAHPSLPVVLVGHSMGGLVATRFAQRHGSELAALVLSGPAIGGNPGIEALLELDPIPEVPIDPAVLSRDPEVGRAYAEDPLVWQGPFKRPTLEALFAAIAAAASSPGFGGLPTLWIHGSDDQLVPLELAREALAPLRGEVFEERIYPGGRHEMFNETNRTEVLADLTAFLDRIGL